MNKFIEELLTAKPESIDLVNNIFLKKYDVLTIELGWLYFKLVSLLEITVNYSESRMIYGKPMSNILEVQKKLLHAEAMILIYKNILISKVKINAIFLFIKSVLLEIMEELLQLHGAYGYCRESVVSEIWLDCRDSVFRLSEKLAHEY